MRESFHIETDLSQIGKTAKVLERENLEFRQFIKHRISSSRLDKLVKEIHSDVASKIDCQKCANCCRVSKPTLTKSDVSRLAKSACVATTEFFDKHLVKDADGDTIFNAKPCPLLANNCCSLYEARPAACRSYPHLHKSDFAGRSLGVLVNFGLCPIVFNTVQRLKAMLWNRAHR